MVFTACSGPHGPVRARVGGMRDTSVSGTSVKLVLPSDVKLIDLVHAASEKMAEFAGFDADEALNVGLALREAVINAMIHGNRRDRSLKVHVTLSSRGREFRAQVRDQGQGFDPATEPDPTAHENLLNTSGRGLLLIRAFVDDVKFRYREGRGTEIILTKRRAQPDERRSSNNGA